MNNNRCLASLALITLGLISCDKNREIIEPRDLNSKGGKLQVAPQPDSLSEQRNARWFEGSNLQSKPAVEQKLPAEIETYIDKNYPGAERIATAAKLPDPDGWRILITYNGDPIVLEFALDGAFVKVVDFD